MDAILNSLGQIPWYGWVAIVAIISGLIYRLSVARTNRE